MRHIIIKCTDINSLSKLIPSLLMEKGYDIIDLFVDGNEKVLEYCKSLAKHYSKTIVCHEKNETDNLHNKKFIGVDGDYYTYLSENIIYIEKGVFSKLFNTKEKNPQYFLTSPLTINNWLSCYLLQNNENYKFGGKTVYQYEEAIDGNDFIFTDGDEAKCVHEAFLDFMEETGMLNLVHCPDFECCTRFPIDCVCWSGKDMSLLLDEFDIFNDESFFTFQYPAKYGKKNLIIGSKIIANYTYEPQRQILDKTDIKERYMRLSDKSYTDTDRYESYKKWCMRLTNETVDTDNGNFIIYRLVTPDKREQFFNDDFHKTLCINAANCVNKKVYDYVDDEGMNISENYGNYGTLTGFYWLMKHLPKTVKYVGTELDDAQWNVSKDDVSRGMAAYDVIMPNQITNTNISNIYTQAHSTIDFIALRGIIKEYFPDYYDTWMNIMYKDEQMGFIKNCTIMKREVFIKMWRFIFDVLNKFCDVFNFNSSEDVERHVRMFSLTAAPEEYGENWIAYQSKLFEFMAERLVTLYIYKNYSDIGLGSFVIR